MSDRKLMLLRALIDMSAMINSTLDLAEIKERSIEAATSLLDAEAGSLLLVDPDTGELFFEVAVGESGKSLKEIRLRKGEGIAGWVALHGRPQIIHDVKSDERFFSGADEKSRFVTRDILCVPVMTKDRVLGVLEVINKRSGRFDEEDADMLTALASNIAVALENSSLFYELRETFHGTALALAETIEKRDPYTGGHTQRVKEYSLAIARILGLGKKDTETLMLAAILHDIGKIGVRDSILLKEGTLDDDEFEQMNRHSTYGAEILKHIRHLNNVIPAVRSHHEKFDGTGYPDGLTETSIPIEARIIAVADTFDAMTTDRPYRKRLSREKAYDELRRCAGTQFDPDIVNAFFMAFGDIEAGS